MIITAGIDPGKKGSIVVLADGAVPLFAAKTPVYSGHYLPNSVIAILRPFGSISRLDRYSDYYAQIIKLREALTATDDAEVTVDDIVRGLDDMRDSLAADKRYPQIDLVVIETQFFRQEEGMTSALSIGEGVGMWKTAMAASGIGFKQLTTSEWEKAVGYNRKKNDNAKEEHVRWGLQLLPQLEGYLRDRELSMSDTFAEAGLMALAAYNGLKVATDVGRR